MSFYTQRILYIIYHYLSCKDGRDFFFIHKKNKNKTEEKPRYKKIISFQDCSTTYSDSNLVMMLEEDYITLTLYGRFSYFYC